MESCQFPPDPRIRGPCRQVVALPPGWGRSTRIGQCRGRRAAPMSRTPARASAERCFPRSQPYRSSLPGAAPLLTTVAPVVRSVALPYSSAALYCSPVQSAVVSPSRIGSAAMTPAVQVDQLQLPVASLTGLHGEVAVKAVDEAGDRVR